MSSSTAHVRINVRRVAAHEMLPLMITSVDELRPLVEGTILAGREMAEVEVPASRIGVPVDGATGPASVLAIKIDSSEVVSTWEAARRLVERTGRWPVAVCSFDFHLNSSSELGSIVEVFDRIEFDWELAGSTDPASIIERSRAVDVDAEFNRLAADASWLGAPDATRVPDAVPTFNDWFEPAGLLVALLLLPDPVPEHALAYVHWFAGNQALPSHVLIAVLRQWREVHGAELVAHWRTMLQLISGRLPASVEEALALARQQELVAPCTTALPGASTEEHAATLMSTDRWFLHERP